MTTATRPTADEPLDLLGIGIGPSNLSLAALAHGIPGLRTAFYERRPHFSWHPGLLIDGASLDVPFLADLVTLIDPTSPWSLLHYLKNHDRLFPFSFTERSPLHRAEYDAYCRWVSEHLPTLHFGHRIDSVRWNAERGLFEVDFTPLDTTGETHTPGRTHARHLALGIGTEPYVPEALRPLATAPGVPVVHSADYLDHRARLLTAQHITVVGSGQSGAEVFLDLLRHRPPGQERLHWLSRSASFAPVERGRLAREHFTPDYARYFGSLPEQVRDDLLPEQRRLYQGIDHGTLTAIHDELYRHSLYGDWPDTVITPGVAVRTAGRVGNSSIELHLEHLEQRTRARLTTDAVVLATGYQERRRDTLLAALAPFVQRDGSQRPRVDSHHRLVLAPHIKGSVYIQNAERHTHGVGTADLGLTAWRSAVILNALSRSCGAEPPFRLPPRTAFTTFGLPPGDDRRTMRRSPS